MVAPFENGWGERARPEARLREIAKVAGQGTSEPAVAPRGKMVEALLQAGADPTAKTDGGKSPMDFAIESDHSDVVALFERATGGA